ncbi:hypothetical protein EO087_13850 [Dyella sp. M7H15-1]|uniref:hemagglutinin repeat-containing protein n=1 Tax=Dyella sp. M7H15-1 TaxID=2501295 RepID=UPI00100518CF|nr:hemagglutinin repeat-containing protein [Dyella sp. M7H15-1]QAU24940.1 hypothetical protein EO087_13850 [Dyella sp. M7H15-1]
MKAGNLLNAGNLAAGGNLSVQTAQDLLNVGTIQGGNVQLVAGNHLTSSTNLGDIGSGLHLGAIAAPTLNLPTGGQIAAIGDLTAQAGHDLTLNNVNVSAGHNLGLAAGHDLTATASAINAGNNMQGIAGNNLNLNAATHTARSGTQMNGQASATHTVTAVTAGGSVVLAAGNDLSSQGTQIKAGDQLAVSAGHDIVLNAVTDSTSTTTQGVQGKTIVSTAHDDETLRGTSLDATNGVAISAGHDLTTVAANVTSTHGGITLAAGNDIHLNSAQENHSTVQNTKTHSGGLFSSTTTTTHDAVQDSYAIGSLLSGNTVTVAAGHDLTATAAHVVADQDLIMAAGNNLTLNTATNTHTEEHSVSKSKSGVMGAGFGVMVGQTKQSHDTTLTQTTPDGTLMGSLGGNISVTAGDTVHLQSATVAALQGDIAVIGRSVNIEEAYATTTYHDVTKTQQSGLTLSFSAPVANAAAATFHAVQNTGRSNDARINAMVAASTAYDAYQTVGAAAAAMSGQGAAGISLTVGSQQSKSETTIQRNEAVGSSIKANGRIDIVATGGGQDSNIRISGSDVYGGTGTGLYADNAIDIFAAQSTSTQHSNNSSSGWNAGLVASVGSHGWAAGITAGVNAGKGHSDGQTITQVNAHVGSGGTTTLSSGGTTTIRGGQVSGDRIELDAADLVIQSLQDTSRYTSGQKNGNVQVTVGYGASASGSYGQSGVNNDYASVNEQSGILAGDGGYVINVKGNTDLIGGIVTSTATAEAASNNRFSTGTLTTADIENHADYSGSAWAASGGVGVNSKGPQGNHELAMGSQDGTPGGMGVNKSVGFGHDGDHQNSVTHAGINTRNLTIHDVAGQAATGNSVEAIKAKMATATTTDTLASNSGALANTFDAKAVENELATQVQVTQAFDQNRQQAKAELYAHVQEKRHLAHEVRMANGGYDNDESRRLDAEAVSLAKTAKWLDVAAMGLYTGTDLTGVALGQTAIKMDQVRRVASAPNTIMLQTCDAGGQKCSHREVRLEDVQASDDGRIHLFNNGIFNNTEGALHAGALQNTNEANAQGVYYILNPYTDSWFAEGLYAAYDKLNDKLGGWLPLTSAERMNQDFIDAAKQQDASIDSVNHSRGSMTWTVALEDSQRQGKANLPIGTVVYNGAAANALNAAKLVQSLGDGYGKVYQATHPTDIVGSWCIILGCNPATSDKNNGGFPSSHGSYTGYLPLPGTPLREMTDKTWGEGSYSIPELVVPSKDKRGSANN